jgi:hypothetical protein
MRKLILFIIGITLSYISNSQEIVGLWLVEQVSIGEESMTPQARWMRFNEDKSQQSGNGWTQHSIGFYQFNEETHKLKIINSNGLEDLFDDFTVQFSKDKMSWTRIEDGQDVLVQLKKIKQLPAFGRDQILGAWENSNDSENKIFFRWDQVFVKTTKNGQKHYGVYKFHAHKPEVELIYYNEDCKREYLKYNFEGNNLILSNIKSKEHNEILYSRTNSFP